MTPEQAAKEAQSGKLRPIYLLLGDERFLQSIALADVRAGVLGKNDVGLNEDVFECSAALREFAYRPVAFNGEPEDHFAQIRTRFDA